MLQQCKNMNLPGYCATKFSPLKKLWSTKCAGAEQINKDIIAVQQEEQQAGILVLYMRRGRVLGKKPYILDLGDKITADNEILPVFLEQYYVKSSTFIPDEVIVEKVTDQISNVKGILAEIHVGFDVAEPVIGSRDEGLPKIAQKNIALIMGQRRILEEQGTQKMVQLYADLEGKVSSINWPMTHMEVFDISNTQGTNPTASMVLFRSGQPAPQEYRRFRIRLKDTPDDVGMMKEVIRRRYSRLLQENSPLPDLVLVDGGKGQLNAAVEVLCELGLGELPVSWTCKATRRSLRSRAIRPDPAFTRDNSVLHLSSDAGRSTPLCHYIPPPPAAEVYNK